MPTMRRRLPTLEEQLRTVTEQIGRISPPLVRLRTSYSELADKRGELREVAAVRRSIADLQQRRADLEGATGAGESAVSDHDMPVSIREAFAERVQGLLDAWHFPESRRVYFDSKTRDLIIDGKHRAARGKGLRAITHAAFTLAILEHCRSNATPHPGFVILDSPLLAYRAPEGVEDDLRGTDLNERFYQYLASIPSDRQVIVLENINPPVSVQSHPQVTFFSANPHGPERYGLFPVVRRPGPESGEQLELVPRG